MPGLKRFYNILRYGFGPGARKRKKEAKLRAREQRFASEEWNRDDRFATRRYSSYEQYVAHQASKLDRIEGRLRETESDNFDAFEERFKNCAPLTGARSVLCLGARLGTEVRALHQLGYFAVGIDLNPGEGNYYVLPGDFHHVVFADGSVDAIYCNALDHVFDLKKIVSEMTRLLRPGGILIADLMPGYEEGSVPGEYETTHWRRSEDLLAEIMRLGGFELLESQRAQGNHRRDGWLETTLRKPA